jgi:IMP dehydrogenase
MQRVLCFDDVLLVPQYSEIASRSHIDLSVPGFDVDIASLTGHTQLTCPVVGSPMDTVMNAVTAASLARRGGFGVLHRYCTIETSKKTFLDTISLISGDRLDKNVMVAVGATGDYFERACDLYDVGCRAFCIDVAHGHHSNVKDAVKRLKERFTDYVHIMTGNVATLAAFNDLASWGSDSIRVGVGGGSMCTTRVRTGHGIPTLQSVMDCATSHHDVLIVADGGIRNSGDAVKALSAGADMLMLGSVLAGHEESPGDVVDIHGNVVIDNPPNIRGLFKKFRGMASREAQLDWRGRVSVVEGESTLIPYKGKMDDTLDDFLDGIRSGLSYSGAKNIRQLRATAKFVTVTSNGVTEGRPHGKT